MAWNESGGGDKDPWGKSLTITMTVPRISLRLFVSCRASFQACSGGGGNKNGSGGGLSGGSVGLLVLLALGLYAFAGVYQVDQQERGVVFRFGKSVAERNGQVFAESLAIDQVDIAERL